MNSMKSVRKNTRNKAIGGTITIGTSTFENIPNTLIASIPAAAKPAPTNPPTKTCVSDIGKEKIHEAITSKINAPTKAAIITSPEAISGAMIPVPIVKATAVPNDIPTKLATVAIPTA